MRNFSTEAGCCYCKPLKDLRVTKVIAILLLDKDHTPGLGLLASEACVGTETTSCELLNGAFMIIVNHRRVGGHWHSSMFSWIVFTII